MSTATPSSAFYDFSIRTLSGAPFDLHSLQGKVVLIVNVASQCGYTPQYAGLQQLYTDYRDRGLVIVGVPCNQFGGQEPGAPADIASFCSSTYGVDFPLTEKVDVNGDNAHPLYVWLKSEKAGILWTEAIKWNFTKFLLDREGRVAGRFGSMKTPDELRPEIEALL